MISRIHSIFRISIVIAVCAISGRMDCAAFSPSSVGRYPTLLSMVGGRGWDNSDYLSGLSGDEEDRKKAQDDYEDFSKSRKAFLERQQEIMKTPQGQAFLQKQQQRNMGAGMMRDDFGDSSSSDDPVFNVQPGSGGGSRMAQMLAQAQKMQEMKRQMGQMGFEQKLATPLDDDSEDDEENTP